MKYCISFLLLGSYYVQGQVPVRIEMGTVLNAAGNPVSDGAMIYGSESLKKNITYDDVKGSPFGNDSFRISILYSSGNKVIGKLKTRINLHNFMVHYLNLEGKEMVVSPDVVKKVQYVDPNDETNVYEEFISDVTPINQKFEKIVFVQSLTRGDVRLLKYINKYLGTYDSLMGNFKRYMFVKREDYFLQKQTTVEPLKKLNKERILSFIRNEKEMEQYINNEKLDLRKEPDVIKLLNHYNELLKQQ